MFCALGSEITNSPTFWEFLTNELVRSGWKEKYERLTERDPRGEAVSAKKTSTSIFTDCAMGG